MATKHISATERFTDNGINPVDVVEGALLVAGSWPTDSREEQVSKLRDAIEADLLTEGVVDELIAAGYVELD